MITFTQFAVFNLSINAWNVLKFLLLELTISVLVRNSYIELTRAHVQRTLAAGKHVALVTTGVGRLTPYDFTWWATSDASFTRTRMRAPRLLLFILNGALALLAVAVQLGSGATHVYSASHRRGYGLHSETRARERAIPFDSYMSLASVRPYASCVFPTADTAVIRPLSPHGSCSPDARSEHDVVVRGCAATTGTILHLSCDSQRIRTALGASTVPRTVAPADIFLVLRVISIGRPPRVSARDNGVERAFVDGIVERAVYLNGTARTVRADGRRMRCYIQLSPLATGTRGAWISQACYSHSDVDEVLFASDPTPQGSRLDLILKYTTKRAIDTQLLRNDTIVATALYPSIIVRAMANAKMPVHDGLIKYVADVQHVRTQLDALPPAVRHSLDVEIADDIAARLLGFLLRIGEYKFPIHLRSDRLVASVDARFIAAFCTLFAVSITQFLLGLRSRAVSDLPCCLEEAMQKRFFLNDAAESVCRSGDGGETFRAVMKHEQDVCVVPQNFNHHISSLGADSFVEHTITPDFGMDDYVFPR